MYLEKQPATGSDDDLPLRALKRPKRSPAKLDDDGHDDEEAVDDAGDDSDFEPEDEADNAGVDDVVEAEDGHEVTAEDTDPKNKDDGDIGSESADDSDDGSDDGPDDTELTGQKFVAKSPSITSKLATPRKSPKSPKSPGNPGLYHPSKHLERVLSGTKKYRFFPQKTRFFTTKNLDLFHRKKI